MKHFARALCIVLLAATAAPTVAQMRTYFDVRVPMRDGVELSTDIWLPDSQRQYPTILIRTPYQKAPQFRRYQLSYFIENGYAVVLQDVRGRGHSDGEFHFYFGEGEDGYDTIEWVAQQQWSNGGVGTSGGSYLGTVQWLAALERPPHLRCMIPTAPSGRLFDELPYVGGAFRVYRMLEWLNQQSARADQSESVAEVDLEAVWAHRPLITMDEFMGRRITLFKEFLEHPTLDAYWDPIHFDAEDFKKIDIPFLTVTGWFDGQQGGTLWYWDGMNANQSEDHDGYLIIGPWSHAQTYMGGGLEIGQMAFAPQSVLNIQEIRRQFFDYCLKKSTPHFAAPRARAYVTGADHWHELETYPPPLMQPTPLYLHSNGGANSLDGDGALSWTAPAAEHPDRFTFDPQNPVHILGLAEDQRPVQWREDVLVYTTAELEHTVEILGRVFVKLYASSDATDTDFTAKIQDVQPDGRAISLGSRTAGVRRARYRNGYEKTELLTPNKPELFDIELFDIGHAFLPGHRIRIEISSSAFPLVNPNQNTGNPVATDTEWQVAEQTIYHDSARASHVLLPILVHED